MECINFGRPDFSICTVLYYQYYSKNERVPSSDTIAHRSDCEFGRIFADSESKQHDVDDFPAMFMYIIFHSKVICGMGRQSV